MHIISKTTLKQFLAKHPTAEMGLRAWYKITTHSQWQHFDDVRRTFPHADLVGQLTVFNIGGNKYRLITKIVFAKKEGGTGKVYIRRVLTHAEYSKDNWKKDSWFIS
jgi:mRNA interferase HigB